MFISGLSSTFTKILLLPHLNTHFPCRERREKSLEPLLAFIEVRQPGSLNDPDLIFTAPAIN